MMTPIKTTLIMVAIIHPIQCLSNHGNAGVPHFDRPRFGSIDRDKRQSNFTLSDLDNNDYNFSTTATFFENSTATTIHSFTNLIPIDDDFQPLFKGRIIPKNELNLTDKAKKVMTELDYYDQDDYGDDEDYDEDDNITSTESPNTNNVTDNQDDDDDDIDKAIGGVAGILDKLIRGPKQKEINGKSRPEDVYIYLSRIIQDEYAKSIKAIMPRVYDYQFVIGERISQRCFNSFVQFANQFRRHSIWPYQMIAASATYSSLNKFALRSYGDFDSCLDIVAHDDRDDRTDQVFFTGQYCLIEVELPLPELKSSITYSDRILDFNQTELSGTFSEYYLMIAPFLYSNPLSFALCLPSTCSPQEIQSVANFFLQKFRINTRPLSDCYSRFNMTVEALPEDVSDKFNLESIRQMQSGSFITQLNRYQILAILFAVVSVITVLFSTIYEVYHRYSSNETLRKSHHRNRPKFFLVCFSFRYSLEQMFIIRDRYAGQQMSDFPRNSGRMTNTACLDAIKSLALAWICLSNFYLVGYQSHMISSLPHVRQLQLNIRTNVFYQIVIQSWLSFDIFFVISGFLLAYTFLPYISKHEGRPLLSFFFAKRFLRLFPSVLFVGMAIKLLPLWQNAGPIYNSSVERILQPCQHYILRSLLFFADFYDYDRTCLPHLWYVSNEFQLSMLGVLVLTFVYNRRKHAAKTFAALIAIGILMSGLIAHRLQLKSLIIDNVIIKERPAIFKSLHFNGFAHFQSYFAGMALAYYCRTNFNPTAKPFNFALPMRIVTALILLTLSSAYVVYIPLIFAHYDLDGHQSNWPIIVYYATARILFIGPTLWMIVQCLPRNNIITKVLSWSIFRICSHLCFQIYLWNLIIIWIYLFTKRTLLEINLMESFPVAMSLFILTVVISMFTFLLFEAPYRNLFRYYFESPRTADNIDSSSISMKHRHSNATTFNNNHIKTTTLIEHQYKHYDNPSIVIDS